MFFNTFKRIKQNFKITSVFSVGFTTVIATGILPGTLSKAKKKNK